LVDSLTSCSLKCMGYEPTPSEWHPLEGVGYPGVSVRVAQVGDRSRIVAVQIENPDGVEPDDLRVPLQRLEALLTEHASAVATPAAVTVGVTTARITGAQFFDRPPPTRRELRIPRKLLTTEGRRYPDALFQRVADLYTACVTAGVGPAPAIAKANDKPLSTVHWWIREARARKFLPPARKKGAAG
jgi:hypothetical protein